MSMSKSSSLLALGLGAMLFLSALSFAKQPPSGPPNQAGYCCSPAFASNTVMPNIMIMLDNSGSMWARAYGGRSGPADSVILNSDTTSYYGYFHPESMYTYGSNKFTSDAAGIWPGRILNWACMSRADIALKVLTGGKGNKTGNKYTLESQGNLSYNKYYCNKTNPLTNFNRFSVTHTANLTYVTVTKVGTGAPINGTLASATVKVEVHESFYGGVLDALSDQDNDEHYDDAAPIFGLWAFMMLEGGEPRCPLGANPDLIDLRNHVNDMVFETWTPLAESHFEFLHYVSQASEHYPDGTFYESPGSVHDPFYDFEHHGGLIECRKTFALLITDGESTKDSNIVNIDAGMPNCTNLQTYYDGILPLYYSGGTDYLDDVVLYGHNNDLRPDSGTGWGDRELNGDQAVELYVVSSFEGLGSNLLKDAAKCGGYTDANGNNRPDLQSEWDENGDSIPDHYYEAENGYELYDAIMSAILDMLASISSSSSVGIVALGTKAGGATCQSQFYPRFELGSTTLTWVGQIQSLWLDQWGYLREDTDSNKVLNHLNDHIITMRYDETLRDVLITRIRDNSGTGNPAQFDTIETVPVIQERPIWDGGERLYYQTPASRRITGIIDFDKDGMVDATDAVNFVAANASIFRPYLGVSTTAAAESLINYIRGQDYSNYRNRTAFGNVWKLGDIINSGPVTLQKPLERYDWIYGDQSYAEYFNLLKDRQHLAICGANDGMTHAFYCGRPEFSDNPIEPMRYDSLPGRGIGTEVWGMIPYNLLPHLKWLKDPDYCHVYYMDLKPYLTDVNIFPDTGIHKNGWGTMLIEGFRLGGMPITMDSSVHDTARSSFIAMDATNPFSPVPMWEFSHPELGLTICYHTAVKITDEDSTRWFYVMGSGPVTCGGESDQSAKIFILDLKTGQLVRKINVPDSNSFITNIFAVDYGLNYSVDRVYFGDCYWDPTAPGPDSGDWRGKIYEIKTNEDLDPANWTMSMTFNMQRPITGEGSVTTDAYNRLWIVFGSGRLFSDLDEADTTHEIYVGVRVDSAHATTISGLMNVTNITIDTMLHVTGAGSITTVEDLRDSIAKVTGWYREFAHPGGEKNLTTSLVFGGAAMFTTYAPTADLCSYGGDGYFYALDFLTGTAGMSIYGLPYIGEEGGILQERVLVGAGMPSEPSLYVSPDETKVYIQAGGAIINPNTGLPGLPPSATILWKGD